MRVLTHPAFIDVYLVVNKSFYVPEKRIWKLKVTWMHRRGWELARENLVISAEKYREFKPR